MTCILAADGVVAADMMACGEHVARMPKLFAFNGSVFASSGDAMHGEAFKEWIEDGRPKDKRDAAAKLYADIGRGDFTAIEMRADGSIWIWECPWYCFPAGKSVYGTGSGSPYALGAYSAGFGHEASIRIASEWDQYTGNEVQQMSLAEAAKAVKKRKRGKAA